MPAVPQAVEVPPEQLKPAGQGSQPMLLKVLSAQVVGFAGSSQTSLPLQLTQLRPDTFWPWLQPTGMLLIGHEWPGGQVVQADWPFKE